MKFVTDIRKSVSDTSPVYAAIGVTDLAVGALRSAREELAPGKLQASAQNLPNVAISKGLEVAGRAEEAYGQLTSRGRSVAGSVRRRRSTRDLIAQAKSARTLGKAAVTTARKAGDDTLAAAKATVTVGRRELSGLVGSAATEVRDDVASTAKQAPAATARATKDTRKAAKRTSTTARTRAAKTTTAAKRARTATTRTAAKSRTAAKGAASSLGR